MSYSSLASPPVENGECPPPLSPDILAAHASWSHRGPVVPALISNLVLRCGVPVLSSILAALLTVWLDPLLTPGRFLLFLAAVVVSAWSGGFPAGLFATVLSALGHVYLLLPVGGSLLDAAPSSWYDLVVFVPGALLISALIGALHAAKQHAQVLAKALCERVLELVEADRRKDDFLALLGHELRNPLGTACHALDVLQLRDDAPTVLWARGVAERQLNLLSRLVDDLLDSSRLVRGSLLLHRDRLDLVRLVHDTLVDYAPGFEDAGLTFLRVLPEGAAWVDGDRLRLAQVLGNLLHNAIKFTHRGGTVTVGLAVDEGRHRAEVNILDTGIGIEPAMLSQVFKRHTQGEYGLGRDHGGLGLGLALVKALIESHGGEVQAASQGPGCGAQLSFWLPLVGKPADGNSAQRAPSTLPTRPLCVLIIEDNRDAAESLKMLLGLSGHDVAVAHSGQTGLALARQLRPDVVLCDLGLPRMDGFAVARMLRQDPDTATAQLFALTGHTGQEDRRRSREAGFDQFLIKPIELTELDRLLAGVPWRPGRP